ncbi:glycerophosphodiester phosphodiesterase [Virgibacillus salinus]|uniref:Glycerophosphoryl diester phosphodiesterase n=1 Tax=Virgibacillus salinus TaxID=553311 RepID=A0A1H1BM07_9BACI|nr:glycerophosphodiester phosphodiesterase [Virgibacillus salinus]SDQ52436.1 glycerophosphoryl diester phosphodiesterase [Virgibacillus salinus]
MTKIIAHRGASTLAPENTMAAFNLAYEQGAEGIETDVHLTKDNVPVLIHDEHVKRTTNSTGYIKDYTFKQLKQLDAGSWFSLKFAGSAIISLEEFLGWIQNKPLCLNIELKNNKIDYKNLENIVYEMVSHYQLLNHTTLSTFNPTSIERLKRFNGNIGVALLTSKRRKNLVSYTKDLGANAIHIKYRLLNQLFIDKCHQEQMAVRVYTINKPAHMSRSFQLGCDGIFTDVPHKALQYRELFKYKPT